MQATKSGSGRRQRGMAGQASNRETSSKYKPTRACREGKAFASTSGEGADVRNAEYWCRNRCVDVWRMGYYCYLPTVMVSVAAGAGAAEGEGLVVVVVVI